MLFPHKNVPKKNVIFLYVLASLAPTPFSPLVYQLFFHSVSVSEPSQSVDDIVVATGVDVADMKQVMVAVMEGDMVADMVDDMEDMI